MSQDKMTRRSRHGYSAIMRGVAFTGVWAAAALSVFMGSQALAQQPPPAGGFPAGGPPPGAAPTGSPAGDATIISSDPKLLSPLPPPSAEVLKKYPPSPDARNLEGVWVADPQPFPTGGIPQLPYTEAAKRHVMDRAQRQREADAQGKVLLTQAGRCRPMEAIGIGSELFPAEIIQTPDKIIVLNEEGRGRWVIHLNGKHPQDAKLSHFGHSVGHWENDTLVVDTTTLSRSEGGFGRAMRSDKARVASRLRKFEGGNRLELLVTVHDSESYTQPIEESKMLATRHPELGLLEFQCEENIEGAREGMVE